MAVVDQNLRLSTSLLDMNCIWIISDGKPGHVNQSLGLAEAIVRQRGGEFHLIPIDNLGFIKKPFRAMQFAEKLPKPDAIIACGHATHVALLLLKWKYRVPGVVLMKPSLPRFLFDLCIIPQHDDPEEENQKIIISRGALNRVVSESNAKRNGLILIGGISHHHGWDEKTLKSCLDEILSRNTCDWSITDSRRTPSGFLDTVNHPRLTKHPHQQTDHQWLKAQMAQAAEIWVTEDSVSMIFEAASSGAKVGLLPMKALTKNGKIEKAIDDLAAKGHITRFIDWQNTQALTPPPYPLQEAARCAAIVIKNLHLT